MGKRAATRELLEFALASTYESTSPAARAMGHTLLVDSLGCALAGHAVGKGSIGVLAATHFGSGNEASIVGGGRSSLLGAAFANGELMNAIDMDAVLVPGHVSPYVIPAVLAAAEATDASGKALLHALVVGHEVAARVSGALTPLRERIDVNGEVRYELARVTGYGSVIIGAAVGAGLLLELRHDQLLDCIGNAAYMAPVPALGRYLRLSQSPMTKYTSSGWVGAGALLAAKLAADGYTGDQDVLDGDDGFWRMFGSKSCDWDFMLDGLERVWHVEQSEIKPYPSFRMGHPGIEAYLALLEDEGIPPGEIESITVRVDPLAASPIYLNTKIDSHSDAYISWAHVLAVSPYYHPGPAWQIQEAIADARVAQLREKVRVEPDYFMVQGSRALNDPVSHPVEVTVRWRGQQYRAEPRPFPKGHPRRPMTRQEIRDKFAHNAAWRISREHTQSLLAYLDQLADLPSTQGLFRALHARDGDAVDGPRERPPFERGYETASEKGADE